MFAQRHVVTAVTDEDGAATVYSAPIAYGLLDQIRYVKTDFDDGSTITVTSEATGETIWTESAVNASATRAPRQATHTTAGAAALYASGGSPVLDKIALVNDRLKVVVASGGNTKTGTFHFTLV